jgi:hypothetical protein
MSEGIQALMALAIESQQPLTFRVAICAGGTVASGVIAPWWYMHDITVSAARSQAQAAFKRVKDEKQRIAQVEGAVGPLEEAFLAARKVEERGQDEVTLYDVAAFPTVGQTGTQSGGVRLPVARIPLASIDAWWVIEGKRIAGTGGFGIGIGFDLPIGN